MNILHLHSFVTEQFDVMYPALDEVFRDAKSRASQGRKTNIIPLMARLRRVLKPYRVVVQTETQHEIPTTRVDTPQRYPQIGGFCYEPTSSEHGKIELIICVHKSSRRFDFTPDGWELFRWRFYKTLLHELVHRAQFAYGKKGSTLIFRPHSHASTDKYQWMEQQYLCDMDEVEAYARDCVEEWHQYLPDRRLTMRALKEEFLSRRRVFGLTFYHDVFTGDVDHPAVQRLFRKILSWNGLVVPLVHKLAGA